MRFFSYLRDLKKSYAGHQPLIEVLIYRKNLLHNLRTYQKKYPHQKIAPVLKSNAYGHGLAPVAKVLEHQNIPFFVVDSLFEARVLRHEGINKPILIIGYTRPEEIASSRLKNVSFAITTFEQLVAIADRLRRQQKFHLKIDTGMHRQGILPADFTKAIQQIKNNPQIVLEGICSHLARADVPDKKHSLQQIKAWKQAVRIFKTQFPGLKYFHLAATAGSYFSSQIPANLIRLGIGLYGIDTSPFSQLNLKPVLEARTLVSGIKKVEKGSYVGYGLMHRAKKDLRLAVIPAGYFEGIDKRLSNLGCYKIGNKFVPLVGRVSMNITLADVTGSVKVEAGDEVVLISANPKDENCVSRIATICDTIPYEILVHIPPHLRRTII